MLTSHIKSSPEFLPTKVKNFEFQFNNDASALFASREKIAFSRPRSTCYKAYPASFPGSAKRQQFQVSRKINFQASGFNPLKLSSVNCEATLLKIMNSVRCEELGRWTGRRTSPIE